MKHKKLYIALVVVVSLVIVAFIIRGINKSRDSDSNNVQDTQLSQQVEGTDEDEPTENTQSEYQSSLSLKAKEEQKERDEAQRRLNEKRDADKKAEDKRKAEEYAKSAKAKYGDSVKVWSSDGVPSKMEDGKSIKDFYKSMRLSDVGSNWGSALTDKDKLTDSFYMVGVDQNPDDYVSGVDMQSFGWLIENIGGLPSDTAIKFTDLNIVGSLSDDHVAVLACYDWYSIWGMKDTLLVFEDISGTLNPKDFTEGKIFSAIAYAHNIKVVQYGGYNIVCVQYNTFS